MTVCSILDEVTRGPSVSALLHELVEFYWSSRPKSHGSSGVLSAEHPEIVDGFTGASEALLEDGDYEVDSEGKRRRKLDVL